MRTNVAWPVHGIPSPGLEQLALDTLAIGVVVTDSLARPIYTNTTADRFLDTPDGALRRVGGRIAALDLKANASLLDLIGRACGVSTEAKRDRAAPADYLMAPSRLAQGSDMAVRVLRVQAVGDTYQAMVFLREIQRNCNLECEARELFGLTVAEAKFASAVATGLSLAEAASAQSVSVATARAHLSRIFQKTGTRQQSQLAALLRGAQIPVDPRRGPP